MWFTLSGDLETACFQLTGWIFLSLSLKRNVCRDRGAVWGSRQAEEEEEEEEEEGEEEEESDRHLNPDPDN